MMTFFSSFLAWMVSSVCCSSPCSLSSMSILALVFMQSKASSRVGIFSFFSVLSALISLRVRSATNPLPFVVRFTSASWITTSCLSLVFLTSSSMALAPSSRALLKLRSVFSGSYALAPRWPNRSIKNVGGESGLKVFLVEWSKKWKAGNIFLLL